MVNIVWRDGRVMCHLEIRYSGQLKDQMGTESTRKVMHAGRLRCHGHMEGQENRCVRKSMTVQECECG